MRHLSIGQRQRVEIIKVLFRGTRVLLLDEPTSVLTPSEVEGLFRILKRLREEGVSVVIITHKLEEALDVSDRVTILRGGRNVGELGPAEIAAAGRAGARQKIVETMFGGMPAAAETFQQHVATGKTLLELQSVSAMGDRGEMARARSVARSCGPARSSGSPGSMATARRSWARSSPGNARPPAAGLLLDGRISPTRASPPLSRAGVGYITDDRMGEGVVPGMSVAQNAALKTINRAPFSKGFFLNRKAIEENANKLIEQFSVKTPSADTRITLLSGGNIQKLMLARELAMNPRVIVCNKPTYGLDLKTAQFVLQTLRQEADSGKAVLLISSELDEILEISDRIGVIYNGEIVETFDRAQIDVETIGRLMLSGRAAVQESAA